MTLVLTVNGPETIWLLADRRLSSGGRPTTDEARKIMFLETDDGIGILGYAGLGATPRGTEPADWMSAVLRGRRLSLEHSLGVLAEAMKSQFPRHMLRMPGAGVPAHNVIVPAFLGNEVRLYTIDMAFAADRKSYRFRYTRHVVNIPSATKPGTPRVALGGSGALYLMRNKKCTRHLLRLVRANDRGLVSTNAVADHLANLNNEVYCGMTDRSVGPRCIVAWRHRKGGVHKGGGGHRFYTGVARDSSSLSLPSIANGMDVHALVGVMMPLFMKMRPGEPPPEIDKDALNAALALLPEKPDEELR